MRFATRAFLWTFIPFALVLLGSFQAIQITVIRAIRDNVRASLRQNQRFITQVQAHSEVQSSRSLRVVAENPALKAGLQLLLMNPRDPDARRTVEDQLREIGSGLEYDFLLVHGAADQPLAGVMRQGSGFAPLDIARVRPPQHGYFEAAGQTFRVASVPIDEGPENLGSLSVGERFDFGEFNAPAVLTRDGHVVVSSLPAVGNAELESALRKCAPQKECEIRVNAGNYLSLPLNRMDFGDRYVVRSLQSVDAAIGPMQSVLRQVFLIAGLCGLVAALLAACLSSRSVAGPLARVVAHLQVSERTGLLAEFPSGMSTVQEIRNLCERFNRAAAGIRDGREKLHGAYVEFVESLASALDARDPYTAGHSRRVSEFSCMIASAMNVPPAELEQIRIAALLHDIGKIGIADSVLQKPGRLTTEEFAIIQQHPSIGRRILEGVQGFHPYLDVVELHHENWDGSGYPHGLRAEAVPMSARIVHVADAYDAMTSDRPYRRGMGRERALRILFENAGTQFDPCAVEVFVNLMVQAGGDPVAKLADALALEADAAGRRA